MELEKIAPLSNVTAIKLEVKEDDIIKSYVESMKKWEQSSIKLNIFTGNKLSVNK